MKFFTVEFTGTHWLGFASITLMLALIGCSEQAQKSIEVEAATNGYKSDFRINISPENPSYWEVDGKTTLLLGGSLDDNLFQMHPLAPHLDAIAENGGNYVRCTMSSRDVGNQWPYQQRNDARYDLNTWSENYWQRLAQFLSLTAEKKIVVQLEIWATWDFYQPNQGWARWPFNPKNNINYTEEESGLPVSVEYSPLEKTQPFFQTVPALQNNQVVLGYQKAFVDKLLEHTLPYQHILYCIDDEANTDNAWRAFWAAYLHQKADSLHKTIYVTEMWDDDQSGIQGVKSKDAQHEIGASFTESPPVRQVSNQKTHSDYIEMSLHNTQIGEAHYQTARATVQKQRDTEKARPINSIKIFGGELDSDFDGEIEDGPERFWRNIFAGFAASRFHRPPAGLGLNDLAKVNLKSMRLLEAEMDFFLGEPQNHLLVEREGNEAYCWGTEAGEYAMYYPGCGEVALQLEGVKNEVFVVKWLDILNAQWEEAYEETIAEGKLKLKAPCEGKWVVLVKRLPQ